MFEKVHIKNHYQNFIILSNANSYAKIHLDKGASLQELVLNNEIIIKKLDPLSYEESFASAILFPFANRIKNGSYEFLNKVYQLTLNENMINAIHGLVFNQQFVMKDIILNENFAELTLVFNQNEKQSGFPFLYKMEVVYKLNDSCLSLQINVKNIDLQPFPFSIGWHPYFHSINLESSMISMNSRQRIEVDEKMIPVKVIDMKTIRNLKIGPTIFDDCFVLNDNVVRFTTPSYKLKITTSEKDSYLQIYTPDIKNIIAIEPMTGPSDNFNNKMGLKELQPNESYSVTWKIELDDE